jgi:hypothetical protein
MYIYQVLTEDPIKTLKKMSDDPPTSLSAEELSAIPVPPSLNAPLPDGAKPESLLVQEELERLLQNCTPEDQKMYEKRFQIIQELLATEWGFVNDMKTLVAVSIWYFRTVDRG